MSVGRVDWIALAYELGTATESSERGGTDVAQQALRHLLGPENIRNAVEVMLEGTRGSAIAESVLMHLASVDAMEMVWEAYKAHLDEDAYWKLSHLCQLCITTRHPRILDWVEELLHHGGESAQGGVNILDQILWLQHVDPDDERVVALLAFAEAHPNEYVREKVAFIRSYLVGRGQ